MTRLCVALLSVLSMTVAANAGEYDWLNVKSMPPPAEVVEAAIKALPKTLGEKQDWLQRMRRAAWYPQLELQYTAGEAVIRDYDVIQRVETTTGSESTRDASRDSGSRSTFSASTSSDTLSDNGGLVENSSSSSEQFEVEQSSSRGSGSGSRSIRSTTDAGPDSFATGEDFEWANEFGVFLTWDLSRLIFQEGEINIVNAEIDRETFRQNVKTQIILTYYDLLEALMLLDNDSYRDSIPTKIRKERQAFLLDELTGGYLTGSRK